MKTLFRKASPLILIFFLSSTVGIAEAQPVFEGANVYVNLAKQLVPSVVNISTLAKGDFSGPGGPSSQEELFRKFFEDFFRDSPGRTFPFPGQPPAPRGKKGDRGKSMPLALGTGFIIDSTGLILTNNHVVAGADEIKIHFTEDTDEEPTDGRVVGRDPELDLALIRVKTKRQLVPVKFGDSDDLQVGEYVMAVGNPFGQGHSVIHGIISAKGRKSPDFALASYLQTDAPINPGNSGGPLVNLKGEVIGINNAIDARAQGIGFAIPINLVKRVLPQLKSTGAVARGYIGVQVTELSPEIAKRIGVSDQLKAAFVAHVYPGSPSEKAGVRPYDIITEFNGKKIANSSDLIGAVTSVPVDQSAKMKLIRDSKEMDVTVRVANRPTSAPEATEGGSRPRPPQKKGAGDSDFRDLTGLGIRDLKPEDREELKLPRKTEGVLVQDLRYDSPADRAGLNRGDIIVEVDRKPIQSTSQLQQLIREKRSYLVRVLRVDPSGRDSFAVLILDLK